MKQIKRQLLVVLVFFAGWLLNSACTGEKLPLVLIATDAGEIIAEVDTVKAPVTAGNFLNLVRNGVYNGSVIYRVVRPDNQPNRKEKIEVIQGGLYSDSLVAKYPVIRHETTGETGILHNDGAISMARNEPGTASTEFFICIGDQHSLDFGGLRNPDGQGYAAFGRVVRGIDVVRKIQQYEDSAQYLKNPIRISNMSVQNKKGMPE